MEKEINLSIQEEILIQDCKKEIQNILSVFQQGISKDNLVERLKDHKNKNIGIALQNLFFEHKVTIDKTNIIKLLTERETQILGDLTPDEYKIYETIIGCGGNGISQNELKTSMKISGQLVSKVIKKFEKKLLIKKITVPNNTKKVIIGYDILPSSKFRNFWFNNQQFDQNLISCISDKICDYLNTENSASRKEIYVYIKNTKLIPIDKNFEESDLQKILNLLVFDDKIDIWNTDNFVLDNGNKYGVLLKGQENVLNLIKYKPSIEYFDEFTALENVPCSFCSVFHECNETSIVNPLDCPHLEKFGLELF